MSSENSNRNNNRSSNRNNRTRTGINNRAVRKAAGNVIFACLIIMAGIFVLDMAKMILDYHKDRSSYDDVRTVAMSGVNDSDRPKSDINWSKLRSINPDAIAWIRLDGTNIDYPIVQGEDNKKYLHTLLDGSSGNAGTLFVDSRISAPFQDTNTIIYGHHMKDGTMFNNLKYYASRDYARKHPKFQISTPDDEYNLRVVAFLEINERSNLYRTSFEAACDRAAFIRAIKRRAEYLTGVTFGPGDRLVMLSTCVNASGPARYVVVGKLEPHTN